MARWAGRFYPVDPETLRVAVRRCLAAAAVTPRPSLGLMAPHAGYAFSGPTAGVAFAAAPIPPLVILLGPKHTPHGQPLAIQIAGRWSIPTGDVPIAHGLARAVLAALPDLAADDAAHREEHALEVLLPFLLERQPRLQIVPIALTGGLSAARCVALGEALAATIERDGRDILLVASTDLHHQGLDELPAGQAPWEVVEARDALAMERLDAMDPRGLLDVCRRRRVSMCGVVPTAVMLAACRALGARRSDRLAHTNSYNVAGGDGRWVVGYSAYRLTA